MRTVLVRHRRGADLFATDPAVADTDIDGTKHLVLKRSDGKVIAAPSRPAQVGYSGVRISDDGKRVGWLVMTPNCCTSYAIPRELVIFKADRVERVIREDQCIFEWVFQRHGTAVAYSIGALHFDDSKRAMLRDVRNGRLLDEYDMPGSGKEGNEIAKVHAVETAPAWVKEIPGFEK